MCHATLMPLSLNLSHQKHVGMHYASMRTDCYVLFSPLPVMSRATGPILPAWQYHYHHYYHLPISMASSSRPTIAFSHLRPPQDSPSMRLLQCQDTPIYLQSLQDDQILLSGASGGPFFHTQSSLQCHQEGHQDDATTGGVLEDQWCLGWVLS